MKQTQAFLDRITGKWWFYVLVFALFMVPPYSQTGIDRSEAPDMIIEVLSNALIYSLPALMPVFKIIPILLLIGIIVWGDRLTRPFDIYVAFTYLLFAFFQHMAFTPSYGFAIVLGNLVPIFIVAILWIWEAIVKVNDFSSPTRTLWRYWVVPFAFLAFWSPINMETFAPEFAPIYILTSTAGLTYCMMTPVYLAILTLYHPRVNLATLRVTSFIGMIIGAINIVYGIGEYFGYPRWMGVLHIPLFSISIYAFVLSFLKLSEEKDTLLGDETPPLG